MFSLLELELHEGKGRTHAHKVFDAQRAFPKRDDADRIRDRVERGEEGQLEQRRRPDGRQMGRQEGMHRRQLQFGRGLDGDPERE